MNFATFSTLDLREQGHKSYVTSYRTNEELVIPQMFSHEYINEGDSQKHSSADDSQYMVYRVAKIFEMLNIGKDRLITVPKISFENGRIIDCECSKL